MAHSKAQKKAGFLLPSPVDGWPLLDVCLKIPNAPEYRRAFVGHLYKLGLWAIWEKSYLPGDTRAKEAGELWRQVLNDYLEVGCDMGCCPEPNRTRLNDDGTYEISYDGGVTWEPGTDEDPRYTSPQFPPIPGTDGNDKKCQAANNVVQQLKDAVDGFGNSLGSGVTILQLALALAGLAALVFITGGLASFLVGAFFELAAAIVTLTKAEYDANFNSGTWDWILCELYCNVGDDGTFSQDQFNMISTDMDVHFSGNAALTFSGILQGWQLPGLNNAARIPTTANLDCSSCGCEACGVGWDVYPVPEDPGRYGTILERGDNYIIVQANLYAGSYFAILVSDGGGTDCCYVLDKTYYPSGGAIGAMGLLCGETYPVHGIANNQCVWIVQFQEVSPFTAKITFGECPP